MVVEFTTVPPLVEVSEPVLVEVSEGFIAFNVHLFEGLVEEVVQLIAAVVLAAAFAWAWLLASVGDWVILVCLISAAIAWDEWVAAASEVNSVGWGE